MHLALRSSSMARTFGEAAIPSVAQELQLEAQQEGDAAEAEAADAKRARAAATMRRRFEFFICSDF
jgi:hypothetical protein